MNKIQIPDNNFDFDSLSLCHPNALQGGSYFTKLNCNGDSLYIQGIRCLTKQGIVKTDKKTYCDLMYSKDDEKFIEWVENLEKHVCKLIYGKRKSWFDNDYDLEDIEGAFTPPIRSYKSGKHHLLRVNILKNKELGNIMLNCYNEEGKQIDANSITEGIKIIPLIEVQGIRFSSRMFQLEFMIKQAMVMNESNFDNCMIINKASVTNESLQEQLKSLPEKMQQQETQQETPQETPQETQQETQQETPQDVSNVTTDVSNVTMDITDKIKSPEEDDNLTLSDDDEEGVIKEVINKQIDTPQNPEEEEEEEDEEDEDEDEEDEEDEDEDEDEEEDEEDEEDEFYNKIKQLKTGDETLEEIDLNLNNLEDYNLKLKNPNEVYFEIWKTSRNKAKKIKRQALQAYLESKKIKTNYMVDDIDNSDDEFDEFMDKYVNRL